MRAPDTSGKNKEQKLHQSLPVTEYRFTVKLRGSYAGIHTPSCSCSLRRASGDTNCPSGRTNPDLFYGNKRDQIKMFPLSEQSAQICPRGPAAPAALSLVYVPVRLRQLPEAPEANRRRRRLPQSKAPQLVSCTRRPQTHKHFWGSVINVGFAPHPGISQKTGEDEKLFISGCACERLTTV